jgi:hypothetical protein
MTGGLKPAEHRVASSEPTVDDINTEFPDAEAFTSGGMCYARLVGIIVIAAAPTAGELREEMCEYFGRERCHEGS